MRMHSPDELKALVEEALERLDLWPELHGQATSVRYALEVGGKRVRPVIALAVGEARAPVRDRRRHPRRRRLRARARRRGRPALRRRSRGASSRAADRGRRGYIRPTRHRRWPRRPHGLSTPGWYPVEREHAGPEHLEADYVAGYDAKT